MSSENPKVTSHTPIAGEVKGAVMKPQTQTPSNTVAPPPSATPNQNTNQTPTAKK